MRKNWLFSILILCFVIGPALMAYAVVGDRVSPISSFSNSTFLTYVRGQQGAALNTDGIDDYTEFILHMDGADASNTFTDSSFTPLTFVTNGSAQMDTARSKFGGASGLFNTTTDFIKHTPDNDFNFGENFTFDLWVNFNTVASAPPFNLRPFLWWIPPAADYFSIPFFWSATDETLVFSIYDYENSLQMLRFTAAFSPSVDTWYHIAYEKTAGGTIDNWDIFINGEAQALTKTHGDWDDIFPKMPTGDIYIGGLRSGSYNFSGWLDEVRLSSTARYGGQNFTPETVAYWGYTTTQPEVTFAAINFNGVNHTLPYSFLRIPSDTFLPSGVLISNDFIQMAFSLDGGAYSSWYNTDHTCTLCNTVGLYPPIVAGNFTAKTVQAKARLKSSGIQPNRVGLFRIVNTNIYNGTEVSGGGQDIIFGM